MLSQKVSARSDGIAPQKYEQWEPEGRPWVGKVTERGTGAGTEGHSCLSWVYLSLYTRSSSTGVCGEHKDLSVSAVYLRVSVWKLTCSCIDSSPLPETARVIFHLYHCRGDPQRAPDDLQTAFWPETMVAYFPPMISKTQSSACARVSD